jgi:hypothetical protein
MKSRRPAGFFCIFIRPFLYCPGMRDPGGEDPFRFRKKLPETRDFPVKQKAAKPAVLPGAFLFRTFLRIHGLPGSQIFIRFDLCGIYGASGYDTI